MKEKFKRVPKKYRILSGKVTDLELSGVRVNCEGVIAKSTIALEAMETDENGKIHLHTINIEINWENEHCEDVVKYTMS
jgi:hypothetical protein